MTTRAARLKPGPRAGAALRVAGLLLVLMGVLAACDDGSGRDLTDGRAVFRATIQDPIPDGVSNIVSTGLMAGEGASGHILYLRFSVTDAALADLLALHEFEAVDCDDPFIQGNLTLSQGLEADITDWRPYEVDPESQCYVTSRSYRNEWTRAARGIFMYQPRTNRVYYNEQGL